MPNSTHRLAYHVSIVVSIVCVSGQSLVCKLFARFHLLKHAETILEIVAQTTCGFSRSSATILRLLHFDY